ncbi:hypothetical protein WICMUC_004668 [Wickerhamomyces mucosus]|uniref:FYVE-type domain-containing protein n=1 Tax=Wickerhamomyces mucosus TaxID=1378264 RepID=A0A9P8TA00_9ASCO|nr:hypothetical protein WICMUC_004668 [Wickerhamomyces mucosus]
MVEELQAFSFSKKQVHHSSKHHSSAISTNLPVNNSFSYHNNGSTDFRLQKQLQEAQQHNKNELTTDDPELDHNQQIRAPKFQQTRSKSDIGSSNSFGDNFNFDHSSSIKPSTHIKDLNKNNQNNDVHDHDDSSPKKSYVPANFDFFRKTSVSHLNSTNQEDDGYNYKLDNFLNNGDNKPSNCINNLEYTKQSTDHTNTTTITTSSSPFSSQKNSSESISSKQIKYTNLAPIRTLDDLKTPNYKPCVLRTKAEIQTLNLNDSSNLINLNNNEIDVQYSELSRDHWKPDNHRYECFDCCTKFSILIRRHHCRKCGEIFCANCLISSAKLNYDCQFELNGLLSKVCFQCSKEWSLYLIENFNKTYNINGNDIYQPDWKKNNTSVHRFSATNSSTYKESSTIPADWSWSSF